MIFLALLETQKADPTGGFIILAVVAAGMLLASRLLYKDPKDGIKNPDKPTTLANRGDWIPQVWAYARTVEPLFAWAGDRHVETTSPSAGGSIGGDNGDDDPEVILENGFHCVAVGIYDYLHQIRVGESTVWTGPITPDDTPSGTSLTIAGVGTFTIYWGHHDQPINAFMGDAARVGIASRWPHYLTIQWNDMVLSGGSTWPIVKYTIGRVCMPLGLNDSAALLTSGTAIGINGGHAALNWLCAQYPDGCGIPLSEIDHATLEAIGVLADTENLLVNMITDPGTDYERLMQALMADYGLQMPLVDARLAFISIREIETALPVVDDDIIMPPDFQRVIDRGELYVPRITFTFKNRRNYAFRDYDIAFNDNGIADQSGQMDAESVVIETATNPAVASRIARRRSQEADIFGAITIEVLRAARQLVAGQAFDHSTGRYRVSSVKKIDGVPSAEMELLLDTYSMSDIDDDIGDPGINDGHLNAEEDIAFDWIQLPYTISPEDLSIWVFRTRAHQQIMGAKIWGSVGGASYSKIGKQNYASAGGLLTEPIGDTTSAIIATGPQYIDSNGDSANLPDLSGDVTAWESGALIALVNNEVFFVESVSVVPESDWIATTGYSLDDTVIPTSEVTRLRYRCTTAGTSSGQEPEWPRVLGDTVTDGSVVWTAEYFAYTPNNMIRAQLDSEIAAHNIGDRIYLADRSLLNILRHPLISDGNMLCIKTVPFTSGQTVDIADVDAVCGLIEGYEVILDGGEE